MGSWPENQGAWDECVPALGVPLPAPAAADPKARSHLRYAFPSRGRADGLLPLPADVSLAHAPDDAQAAPVILLLRFSSPRFCFDWGLAVCPRKAP